MHFTASGGNEAMHQHELRFISTAGLARAFGRLHGCPQVQDCLVDEPARRLSFTAPAGQAARLMMRLHGRGELAEWSFRQV